MKQSKISVNITTHSVFKETEDKIENINYGSRNLLK